MNDTILVLNAGSSSIKFQLFDVVAHDQLERRLRGQMAGVATRPRLVATNEIGETLLDRTWPAADVQSVSTALEEVLAFLRENIGGKLPAAIGHRVVHGGPLYAEPLIVNETVLDCLERFVPLAPLHQPNNLRPIYAILARQPDLLQVACFDTAFHRSKPQVADHFAIPQELYLEGVRRYGFHGLSYEYIANRLLDVAPEIAGGRVVVAHLGSGASMAAISAGKSIESTMGFTALDGLPMGTRPGRLDPGVLLYLANAKNMSTAAIEQFLYGDCGLKGLSGISNDVRTLLASPDPRAQFALEYFVYQIALFTGMLTAAMGGIDGFVFTGGIGENAAAIREAVVRRLAWLNAEIDVSANENCGPLISRKDSRVKLYVIPTDEELMIARHTLHVLRRARSPLLA
jgi:acetate kinase